MVLRLKAWESRTPPDLVRDLGSISRHDVFISYLEGFLTRRRLFPLMFLTVPETFAFLIAFMAAPMSF